MGEGKGRRSAAPWTAPEHRDVIAAVVRSATFVTPYVRAAQIFRNLAGQALLTELGVQSRLARGAVLYRAGHSPCNVMGIPRHAWLEVGPNLVDFSAGDWWASRPEDDGWIAPPPAYW